MKRYILFGGYNHYPKGGFKDFIEEYDDIETAKLKQSLMKKKDWYQIFDMQEKTLWELYENGVWYPNQI